jgi:hypothetical protein
VTTTVTCDVCAHQTQTIVCPNVEATNVVVAGNGVTATVAPGAANTAAPGAAQTAAGGGGAAAAPTVTGVVAPGNTGAASSSGFVTVAGAPLSMKKSLGLMAGLALVAGQFLML